MRMIAILSCAALAVGSCASRLHVLPSAIGEFAPRESMALLTQLERACHESADFAEPSWVADVQVRGSVGRDAVDRRVRVAFNPTATFARMESIPARGPGSFLLATSSGRLTLLLDDEKRAFEHDRFTDVMAAIAGVNVDARELGLMIRGCHLLELSGFITNYGENWRLIPGGKNGKMYFHRDSPLEPWRMVTLFYPGDGLEPAWRMDYRDFDQGIARTLIITGMSSGRMKLDVMLSNIALRASLPPTLFQVEVQPSSQPIAMSEISARHLFGSKATR